MTNREAIAWLDGYLKGVTALQEGVDRFKLNALSIDLTGPDIVQSYLDFININDEAESLGIKFPLLKLEKREPVDNWSDVVAENIGGFFSGIEAESYQGVVSKALDVLDMVVPERNAKQKFRCIAQMGKASGEYLFLQLSSDEYLVLSFLRHRM